MFDKSCRVSFFRANDGNAYFLTTGRNMNKKLINLQLIALELDGGLPVGDFNDRLIVQKRIYLLQKMGMKCGYRFHWYLRGPYCSELTECAFGLQSDPDVREAADGYTLRSHATEAIARYKTLEDEIPADIPKSEKAAWLELLASIHFLRTQAYVQGGVTKDNIGRVLKAKKKPFNQRMITKAWKLLDDHVF